MATHSSIFPGESHGLRSLAGYSSQGHKKSDTTGPLSTAQHIEHWGAPGGASGKGPTPM